MGIEIFGRFLLSRCWIVVCVDYATGYVEAKALLDEIAENIATLIFHNIIIIRGAPRELISDR